MEIAADYRFEAPVTEVWALLMDTTAIAACIPGCRGLTPRGENRYETELGVAMSAISGSFKGTVAIEDIVPPRSYRLVVEGSGRTGFVKGNATITLATVDSGTRVSVAARADVGGTIARVGQRLLDGVARSMTERFFACMSGRLTKQ